MGRMSERAWEQAQDPANDRDLELCELAHYEQEQETATDQELLKADETSWNYFVNLTTKGS
jgi:hypothetical protein